MTYVSFPDDWSEARVATIGVRVATIRAGAEVVAIICLKRRGKRINIIAMQVDADEESARINSLVCLSARLQTNK